MNGESEPLTLGERISGNANLVIQRLSSAAGFELGFDEASVVWIDGFVERVRSREDFTMELAEGLVNTLGAFLGECLCVEVGGRWVEQPDGQVAVVFSEGNAAFPFNKVRKHFENGSDDSLLSFYQTSKLLFGG